MRTKSKNWREAQDRWDDSLDPQLPKSLFVPFCDEALRCPESSDEVETPQPDQSAPLPALGPVFDTALTRQEQYVLFHRQIGITYAVIAKQIRPRLSGPSQARKIEQRVLRKMRERLSKFRKPTNR